MIDPETLVVQLVRNEVLRVNKALAIHEQLMRMMREDNLQFGPVKAQTVKAINVTAAVIDELKERLTALHAWLNGHTPMATDNKEAHNAH